MNSPTVRSTTKFMFCDSCAISFRSEAQRQPRLERRQSSIRTRRPDGVSPCARHSMSASSRLLPEPVGPTMHNTSPGFRTIQPLGALRSCRTRRGSSTSAAPAPRPPRCASTSAASASTWASNCPRSMPTCESRLSLRPKATPPGCGRVSRHRRRSMRESR